MNSFPSDDLAFAAAARRAAADADPPVPEIVESLLRVVYPRASVRRRELSAEPATVLYAYRDGTYAAGAAEDWTTLDGTAWAAFEPATGQILDANEAMRALFGVTGTIVGRYAREFVPLGAEGISDDQLRAIAAAGSARSSGLARRDDGSPLHVEFVARVVGDRLEGWYRAATREV